MGKVTGFLEFDRQEQKYQLAADRVRHFREFTLPLDEHDLKKQAARCMDCGIPFCHGADRLPGPQPDPGLERPRLPVATGRRRRATSTPPTTSPNSPAASARRPARRPARSTSRTSRSRSRRSSRRSPTGPGTRAGSSPSRRRSGPARRVAVVGSGPAGLAAAQQLARVGHDVHVFEREPKAGGLLRYGIPDFKMEKRHIDRRVTQMEAEGVVFHYGVECRRDAAARRARRPSSTPCCSPAAPRTRATRSCPARISTGVHYAMPFLVQSNRRVGGEPMPATARRRSWPPARTSSSSAAATRPPIASAPSFRQGALSVTQLDIRPRPPEREDKLIGLALLADQDAHLVEPGRGRRARVPGRDAPARGQEGPGHRRRLRPRRREAPADPGHRVRAAGRPRLPGDRLRRLGAARACSEQSGVAHRQARQRRGERRATTGPRTTKIYAAGDMRRGQSLVVWAIREGRQAARAIDEALMGASVLPR